MRGCMACICKSLESRHAPMSDPLSRIVTWFAYGLTQLPRVGWYLGHGFAMHELSQAARRHAGPSARRTAYTKSPIPSRSRLYADMAGLFFQDLANIEAGLSPLPADHDGSLPTLFARSPLFFSRHDHIFINGASDMTILRS